MMKLLFLCGSLEAGKDGVGDYTRRLGVELVNQGHQVQLVALHDNVTLERFEQIIVDSNLKIDVVRFSSLLTWRSRIDKLERLLNIFRPDWISLQYVPYSYQKKGIAYELAENLKLLSRGWKWHINFHETWIGFSSLSPLKHKIVGFFQRRVAKSLIRSLNPTRISTSNRLYQILLAKAKITASIVRIFSNISIHTSQANVTDELLRRLQIDPLERNNSLILGVFGTLHQGYDFYPIIDQQLNLANSLNKRLVFVSFGRVGALNEFNRIKSLFQSKVDFFLLGELPEHEVSGTLQILDVAISSTPLEHIGKSGVYAAMRFHDLNVLLPFSDKLPEFQVEIKMYNKFLTSLPSKKWGVECVAREFVQFLGNV